ncbi:MAG: hypothetical protein ACPGPA_03080 [Alphaproteobacteria bacterium]
MNLIGPRFRGGPLKILLLALLTSLAACSLIDQQEPAPEPVIETVSAERAYAFTKVRPYGLYRQSGQQWESLEMTSEELHAPGRRCIRQNNYWCVKTPKDQQWKGQIGADASGHAAFVDPVYSARAFARLMRIYRFRHDLVTVREVARRYAPPGDCIGSLSFCPVSEDVVIGPDQPQRQVGDQVITYSLTRPGDGFERKPLEACSRPLLYCPRGINRSEAYAATLAAALGLDSIDDDIALFDEKGRLDFTRAQTLFQAMTRFELGADYAVDPTLIRRGILMEARDYLQENQRLY